MEQNKTSASCLASLGMVVFGVALLVLSGYVLSQIWAWFVVPLGVPAIGVPQAIGISTLGSFFFLGVNSLLIASKQVNPDSGDNTAWLASYYFNYAIGLFVIWGLAAVTRLFM